MRNIIGIVLAIVTLTPSLYAESAKSMALDRAKKIKEAMTEMKTKCPDLITEAKGCSKKDDYKNCLTD